MVEYTSEILHQLWDAEMEIYFEFKRICDAHNLAYFGAYGTALGAIRHKGFIPWDDDIDVAMPRKDYETFIEIARSELNDRFELLEPRTTKGYVMTFAKLTNRNTTFTEATDTNRKYHSGIFIDIFPFDVVFSNADARKASLERCWRLSRMMVLSEYPIPKLPKSVTGAKAIILKLGCICAHGVLRLAGQTNLRLYQKLLTEVQRASNAGETNLYTDIVLYKYEDNYGKTDVTYPSEMLFPAVSVPYEQAEMTVPNRWDDYLSSTYGDYMQVPPPEKRHCHTPAVLEFET